MRWQLGQWGFEKKLISKLMMSNYSEMKVGNEDVLQVFVEYGSLHLRTIWHPSLYNNFLRQFLQTIVEPSIFAENSEDTRCNIP